MAQGGAKDRRGARLVGAGCREVVAVVAAVLLAANRVIGLSRLDVRTDTALGLGELVLQILGLLAVPVLFSAAVITRQARRTNEAEAAELADRRAAEQAVRVEQEEARHAVEEVLASTCDMQMHFQPIIDLRSNRPIGHEALARFPHGSPDEWFTRAAEAGLATELELAAVAKAIVALDSLDGYVSINISPPTLLCEEFWQLVEHTDHERVVIELTEHVRVDEYGLYEAALARLRQLGLRLAVDDAGAGHSSMRHIINMAPEIIKLDRSLTSMVDTDPVRRSLIGALVGFANAIGATVVAEGIERSEEAAVMEEVGVAFGQGWLYSKAKPLIDLTVAASHPQVVPVVTLP